MPKLDTFPYYNTTQLIHFTRLSLRRIDANFNNLEPQKLTARMDMHT